MKDTHIACTMSLPLKYWEGVKYYFTDLARKGLTQTLLRILIVINFEMMPDGISREPSKLAWF